MPALLILNYDVTSEAALQAYRAAAAPVLLGPGRGELLASARGVEFLPAEGAPLGTHTVVLRFPDVETARATYHAEAYRPLLEARLQATTPRFGMILPTVE
jgi:uncharacterized protein (DUF1330 family)